MTSQIIGIVAILALIAGVALLERGRAGLEITHHSVGTTPVTVTTLPGAEGPLAVIVHGFAGSRQIMQAWSESFARAGYRAIALDLQGHGRNPVPMSGDVTSIDGTTRLLLEEIDAVIDWAKTVWPDDADGTIILGHSMSSDLVVRQALADPRIDAVIGVSVFSVAITPDSPENLLIINGAWEGALRSEAVRVMAELGAQEGDTVGQPGAGFARRAVAIPFAEHVSILWAPAGLREAVSWADQSLGRASDAPVARLGLGIVLAMFGAVLLARPLSALLPPGPLEPALPNRVSFALALGPAVLVPPLANMIEISALPVLVADYLAIHLALYGLFVTILAHIAGYRANWSGWAWGLALGLFGLAVLGGVLDRYVASFFPHAGRIVIILAILPGAILAMWGDAILTRATAAPIWQRILVRGGFLGSLAFAVALDFERLFFLVLILPVIALFYATFGMMGRWLGRRTGSSVAVGLGLGILLAWSIGVSFPLYVAQL